MTTMANGMLSCSVEEFVATLTINHSPANTLTVQVLDELEAAFDGLAKDDAVKAVIVTGAGRFFIAGADIRALAAIASAQEGERMALRAQAIGDKIEAFEKPVIAAINGVCLGGGLELAMCCHIRLASDGARLGQPEINLGMMPGMGGTQRLPRLIGRSKATELILTGDVISAQEAKVLGLVSRVIPSDDLLRQARGLARKIASKGRAAVRAALRAIREGAELNVRQALVLEARLFGTLCETEDGKEGLAAFLERRQPRFKDR